MEDKSFKHRLKKTHSGRIGNWILLVVVSLCMGLCLALGLLNITSDNVGIGSIFLFLAVIMLPLNFLPFIVSSKKDKKLFGKGRWSVTFDGNLSPEQKDVVLKFLQESGFSIVKKEGSVYFLKTKSFIQLFIKITALNETIMLKGFLCFIKLTSKESGLYGFLGMWYKYKLRKIIAHLLDMLKAPRDITV